MPFNTGLLIFPYLAVVFSLDFLTCRQLQLKHVQIWHQMGEPELFIFSTSIKEHGKYWKGQFKYVLFLFSPNSKRLGNPLLTRLLWSLRGLIGTGFLLVLASIFR